MPHLIDWNEFKVKWEDGVYINHRILFYSNEPIGWAKYFISKKKPWICGIGLFIALPKLRGQGLGAQALQALMDEVSVMMDVGNKAAQAMFVKLGFVQEGLFKCF